MNEQQYNVSPSMPEEKIKVPVFVVFFSWLILLGGILALLSTFIIFALNPIIGIVSLIFSLGYIIVSFGLRKTKRWALYGFTVAVALGVVSFIYVALTSGGMGTLDWLQICLPVLFLIYFWSIFKKFR